MEKIKDKKIIIAGATGSIGKLTAKLLTESGAQVFITGKNETRLKKVAEELRIPFDRAVKMDITNTEEVNRFAAELLSQAGPPDVLINATGVGIIHPVETLSVEDFQRTIDINLTGAYRLIKAFLPAMKEQKKGLLIHIPGVLGKTPMAGAAAYAASKYGLNGMMKSIREELKRTDIRITQLFLGGVDSAFWDTIDLRVQKEKMIMAEEAARAIWFLCQQPTSGVVSEMVIQPFNHQAI